MRRIASLPALVLPVFLAACARKPDWTPIGSFVTDSGELVVADPGYSQDDIKADGAIAGRVKRVKKGVWTLSVRYDSSEGESRRCSELLVKHESVTSAKGLLKNPQKGTISVDSGQAGVFDALHFRDPNVVPKDHAWKDKPTAPDDLWFSLCCEQTDGAADAGVIPYGAVASSGDGDGSYTWVVYRNKLGDAVAVRIIFTDEDDDD